MYNSIKLRKVVNYSEDRINSNNVLLKDFVTVDNLLPNKGGITIAENMPPQGGALSQYKKENILVGNIRPYLKKIWFANRDGGSTADVLVFKVKSEYYPKFVYYAMFRDDFFDHMMRGKKGTKMPRGDKNQILEFLIPDIKYTSQQKIANVLSVLDSKIELNNRINSELEAMAKTLYDYWFVQFDFPDANGKPYKTSGGKMVWNKELKKEIPEGWKVKKICELAETASGGTPKSTIQRYYENGNIPWVNSGELNSLYIFEVKKFITEEGLKNSSAKMLPENSILVALYGATAGKVSMLKVKACTNQAVCAVLPKNQEYINIIRFTIQDLYNHLVKMSSGSARDNLSQDIIKNIKVIVPNKDSLKQFNNIVNPCIDKIVMNIKENILYAELRDWLLPMLMNGKVKVE